MAIGDPVVVPKDRRTRRRCLIFPGSPGRLGVCLPTVARSDRHYPVAEGARFGEWSRAMRWIIEANIARLKALLTTELDPTRRAMETRLLAEEEEKLSKQVKPDEKQA